MWYQIFLSNANNLETVVWFQVFQSNTNNYKVSSHYFYSIIVICSHTTIYFQCATNNHVLYTIIASSNNS